MEILSRNSGSDFTEDIRNTLLFNAPDEVGSPSIKVKRGGDIGG